ncbi:MAG: hypothetical protein IJO11_01300, partial [Alphaproteobacteria bacterium]|nr:hypothetical protein [Alphaproteobacteria bacterium]
TNASWDSTNKKCVCSSGSWSASSKKCVTTGSTQDTCYAPKVWSGGSCACPSDKPTWDSTNNQCVACTTAKPYWDSATQTCKTCYEVNNAEPKWNTSTSACEACPTANPIWNGSSCITTATWCTNQMKSGGFSSGYSVSGSTITYSGNMTVSKNLDISKCNLTVNGTLTINSGITLTALAVSATSSSGHGVRNSGIVIATSLLGKSTETQDNIYHHGIFNDGGTITVSNGAVTGETADQGKGIYSWNYNSTAQISAKTIKGTCTGNPCTGIDNSGIITATTSLTGTGTTGITHSGGGTITVTNGSVTGTGSSSYGINLSSGQITAKTITGKSNGTSSTGYGIKIDRNCILTGTGSITGSGYVGIKNEGTITATGITVTGTGVSDGIYNNYSSAKISAATIKGTSTSTGLYSGILVAYGTITATTSVIGTGTTGIDVYSGTITATNGSVSGTGSTDTLGRGIDVSSGKITAKTIEGNGYFGIYNEGIIKGTNSITGIGSSQGIWNDDGTITATVTVTGEATGSEGIYNNSSINSPTIKGSSTNGSGITSYGTLTASSSIIGTGKRYGINNRGTITATNASISGTGNSMDGIYNRVKITAKTITGKSTNGYGINNTQSSSSITATNIYYCKTRQNNGTISGTQKCASGCTCTN